MAKAALRNRHQKAAFRPGEKRVTREQVRELLVLSQSADADERLTAATFLCPCHVRGRGTEIWSVIQRLMRDDDPRVRAAAWHTLSDGGLPKEEGVLEALSALFEAETDPKVRKGASYVLAPALAERERRERTAMLRPASAQRGKCDFCSDRDVLVGRDYDTMIPGGGTTRPALVCRRCAAARR